MNRPNLKSRIPRITRDGILFLSGLLGIAHETLISEDERPTLLFGFMAMVGLPAFLRADEKSKSAPPPEPAPPAASVPQDPR